MWATDASGTHLHFNKEMLVLMRCSAKEIEGLNWSNFLHPEDSSSFLSQLQHGSALQAELRWDGRLQSDNAGTVWVFIQGKPRFDDKGAYLGHVGTVTDISARKEAEHKLRDQEERLRISLESTGLGTWDFNPATGDLDWDKRTRDLFGLSETDFVDYNVFLSRVHPADRLWVDDVVKACFDPATDGRFDVEYRTIALGNGSFRWISAKGRAFFTEAGSVRRFIGTVFDITERKTAEDELRQKDHRLREALLVASTGTWKIDLSTGIDTRDASLNKMLGLDPVETQIPLQDSFTRIHPADKTRMQAALDRAIAERGAYHEELRVFLPDGRLRWIKDRGQVIADENGEPLYIIGAAIDITEEKEREEALKINEERFRGVFDNAQVGMVMLNLNGKFLRVNPKACEIFGYNEDELLEMDMLSITHPAFRSESMAQVKEVILGQRGGFVMEKKYLRKDGTDFWGQVSVSVVRNLTEHASHLVAIVTNIHDRKLAEESLKMQAQVLESMDEGVSVSDETGLILYTNSAEDTMFGYEPGELLGQHVTVQNAYSAEENERIVADVIHHLKTQGFWNGEWHNRRKDGSHFYTYSHISAISLGEKQVFVCVQRDITEEKRYKEFLQHSAEVLEQRVQDRTRELKEAAEKLERSNEELEQFAYITSHDLQEPLRKIKTFANRVADELSGTASETVYSHLSKVISSAERMSALIRDLLDYSTLKEKREGPTQVALNDVLKEVLTDFEVLIAQKGAVVEADPLPTVSGIALQLNQLFFNLIGNSLKFSKPEEPPRIRISAHRVEAAEALELKLKEQPYWSLEFRDNGIGFNPKYSEQIFEIFQRLNSRDRFAGTGIGLALSKRVVDNHNGLIIAQSAEGQGATFTVYLPA